MTTEPQAPSGTAPASEDLVKVLCGFGGAACLVFGALGVWLCFHRLDLVMWAGPSEFLRAVQFADALPFVTGLLIVAGVFLFYVASKPAARTQRVAAPLHDLRECPFCAETIKRAAKVCRFCGRDLLGPEA